MPDIEEIIRQDKQEQVSAAPEDEDPHVPLEVLIDKRIQQFLDGFEERLARSMQRALDTVLHSLESRIQQLEEDQARILRHLGLDDRGPASPEDRGGVEL